MKPTVRAGRSRPRVRVAAKFAISVGVLLLAMLAIAGVAGVGLTRTDAQAKALFNDNLVATKRTADLNTALDDVHASALQLIPTVELGPTVQLDTELDEVLIPEVREDLAIVRTLTSDDPAATRQLDQLETGFNQFLRLRQSGVYSTTGEAANSAAVNATLARHTSELFAQITKHADAIRASEYSDAALASRRAHDSYRSTLDILIGGIVLALVFGLALVLLLVRNLVPRIRTYSQFASALASGQNPGTLRPRGGDELADLGRALNDMVAKNQLLIAYEAAQAEFVDTLQVTYTEEEAHELVQRHIERSLPGTAAIVLKRNNSDNRLQAATPLAPGSDLADRLVGAEPRFCLALRFSRTHREGTDPPPLLSCELCCDSETRSTCEPLLVGGAVIGSVLVTHQELFDEDEAGRIKNSVAQAAPVLANLRNLALAEFRANNDALTALPNKRATDETLKRMVAQANRSVMPLTAAMLDLDHFKQINDRYGHGKGDEVLAAVGVALGSCLRASDFAGRYGGEEFLILMPGTTADGGVKVAEKIRTAIAAITIPGVERDITASIGVADLLAHAGDPIGLVREADRALYAAKAAGRNRTLVAETKIGDEAGLRLRDHDRGGHEYQMGEDT